MRPATRAERGQALVVIGLAMVGLIAFVGLMVDAGILFIAEGHLRRAVDAAALAAASQFRVGSSTDKLLLSADEVVHLNGVDPATLTLGICSPGDPLNGIPPDPHNDNSLCPTGNAPHRKLVKVTATTNVTFAFLGIIGIPNTVIQADSVSETASVDVVLVIDTSNSMTFNINKWSDAFSVGPNEMSSYWFPDGPLTATVQDGCNQDPLHKNPDPSYTGYCLPFDQVKHAAVDFVHHLYWPYDRLAIVTFDRAPVVVEPLNNTDTQATWENKIKALTVSPPRDPGYTPQCQWTGWGTDPSGCTNTSTGGALQIAGGQFGISPIRQESVWVVILLTDGAANASGPDPLNLANVNRYCPASTWSTDPDHYDPFCRFADKTRRHTVLNPNVYNNPQYDPGHTAPYNPANHYDISSYDADDYARDNADFVACAPKYAAAAKYCRDSLDYTATTTTTAPGGQGALIYSIGLGNLVIDNQQGGGVPNPNGFNPNPSDPSSYAEARVDPSDPTAGYAAGDNLLRYIARVGQAGDPNGPDPCQGVPAPTLVAQPVLTNTYQAPPTIPIGNLSYNCGNYYFSQTGTGLNAVFQSIASRIFTRLTQ